MELYLPTEQIQLLVPERMHYEGQNMRFSYAVSHAVFLNVYVPGSVLVIEDVKMNVFPQGAHVYANE